MKKFFLFLFCFWSLVFLFGCGYSTKSSFAGKYHSIHITKFENQITFVQESAQRNLYFPLLEVDVHNAIVNRFVFDGNLRSMKHMEDADLTLKGVLKSYRRVPLRYTDNDDVEEYRVYITVGLELWGDKAQKMLWKENSFVGEATYFVSGSLATTEESAVDEAIIDLARRIVERVIEDW